MFNPKFIAALLIALATAVPSAASAAPAKTGAIVYSMVTVDKGGAEVEGKKTEPKAPVGGLYAVRDHHLNQLTEDPTDAEPSFSADGTTIAFSRAGDIYAMRADGSGQRRLTSGAELDSRPIVSPNGRLVVFERRAAADQPRDLYTVKEEAPVCTGSPPPLPTSTKRPSRPTGAASPSSAALPRQVAARPMTSTRCGRPGPGWPGSPVLAGMTSLPGTSAGRSSSAAARAAKGPAPSPTSSRWAATARKPAS
jgi:hypothetical protein